MLIKKPFTVCVMITPRRIVMLLFLLTLIVNGAYKYLEKGVYHDYSQWDLRSHITGLQWVLSGSPAPAAGAPEIYLPPYLPLAFPLLDLAGRFEWQYVKVAWLLLLGGFLAVLFGIMLEELHQIVPLSNRRAGLMSGISWLFPATFLGLAAGHLAHLFDATEQLAALGVNNPALMGESGRIDLAPLAALFDIHWWNWSLLATGIVLCGLIWLYRRREMDPRLLLLNLNLLIFLLLYHRAYDLVLPLQWLFHTGRNIFPAAAPFWHLIGSSSAIALLTLAVCANRLSDRQC